VLDTHLLNAGSSAILFTAHHCILCKFNGVRCLQILELYPTRQFILPQHK
jgi:hypothetical protein